ncbi:MAG: rhomboid family intramembrane serine protease [Solirubrobacteraceae bacterium]|nr:rhomboid family intramembrane serine protease [Solirubrobacteraceae bacterium]
MTQPIGDKATAEAVCFRHTNRPTNVSCQNCGKPICSDCMRESPVGYRCPDCAPKSKPALADDLMVTKTIIGINVFVFVLGIVLQAVDGFSGNFVMSSTSSLTTEGSLIASACQSFVPSAGGGVCIDPVGVANGEWYRLITSGFLHSGLLHIGFNMYFIWMFGQLLEPSLGRMRFSLVYFVSLLGGAIGALLYSAPNAQTVGASGAAFGLLGAALVVSKLRRIDGLTSDLLMIAGLNFAIGFIPGLNISIGGHLGGFVVGALAGYIAFGPLARQRGLVTGILCVAAVALFIGGIAVAEMRAVV